MSPFFWHDLTESIDAYFLRRIQNVQLAPGSRGAIAWAPAEEAFWDHETLLSPPPLQVMHEWPRGKYVELYLRGRSHGPGGHPGADNLYATAHVRTDGAPAPLILLIHGYAVPITTWDAWQAYRLRQLGANTVRIDLPFHLRRRIPGFHSGDGYLGMDAQRIRDTLRQSVEDCAAVVAWARREVTPHVGVLGVSLGGLIATLLAANVELDSVVAITPLCDPATTMLDKMPSSIKESLGLEQEDEAQKLAADFAAALLPLTPRSLYPKTPGERITLVQALRDGIVGCAPVAELAQKWGTELWDLPAHGHITALMSRGLGRRVRERLLQRIAAEQNLMGRQLAPVGDE